MVAGVFAAGVRLDVGLLLGAFFGGVGGKGVALFVVTQPRVDVAVALTRGFVVALEEGFTVFIRHGIFAFLLPPAALRVVGVVLIGGIKGVFGVHHPHGIGFAFDVGMDAVQGGGQVKGLSHESLPVLQGALCVLPDVVGAVDLRRGNAVAAGDVVVAVTTRTGALVEV